MAIKLWYEVITRDPQGKIVSREQREAKSFVRQWNDIVHVQFTQVGTYIKHIDGTTTLASTGPASFYMKAAAGTDDQGVVVGTGETAVTISDFKLEAQILHGAGAGQLNYGACNPTQPVEADPTTYFMASRTFTNNSGNTITIKETGLYAYCYGRNCVARDVLETPQDVLNGGNITVNYRVQVSV